MRLTVLVDNNTLIDKNFLGEPGLSFYIEENGKKILFDLGYSDVCIRNSYKMGIDINDTDMVVFSHGHLDHTWGLTSFIENLKQAVFQEPAKRKTILAHPFALAPKLDNGEPIGFIYSRDSVNKCFDVRLSKEPVWITDKLCFLGQIERTNDFENKNPIGTTFINGIEKDDYIQDDTALAYKSKKGLVIITGCSHAGICNIIEYAKKVCKEERIIDIIGGFHLQYPEEEQLANTIEYMRVLKPEQVHACHCTDLYSKIALSKVVDIREVGVGLVLEYE